MAIAFTASIGRNTHAPGAGLAVLVFACLLIAAGGAAAQDTPTFTLEISAGQAVHEFTVEHAITPAERARGLMFRRHMPADHGMLFDFATPQIITMWMRNTPISLDMVFADETGTIVDIAARTTPYSERTIASRVPARFVLEINGGRARALGIKAGDRLSGPLIPAP